MKTSHLPDELIEAFSEDSLKLLLQERIGAHNDIKEDRYGGIQGEETYPKMIEAKEPEEYTDKIYKELANVYWQSIVDQPSWDDGEDEADYNWEKYNILILLAGNALHGIPDKPPIADNITIYIPIKPGGHKTRQGKIDGDITYNRYINRWENWAILMSQRTRRDIHIYYNPEYDRWEWPVGPIN